MVLAEASVYQKIPLFAGMVDLIPDFLHLVI